MNLVALCVMALLATCPLAYLSSLGLSSVYGFLNAPQNKHLLDRLELHACLGLLFGVLMNVSFYSTMKTCPGELPVERRVQRVAVSKIDRFDGATGHVLPGYPSREHKKNGCRRFCGHCKLFKPDRAHHCRTCKSCFLKMDHHCVFFDCCIGLRNQKMFVLSLFYMATGASYYAWSLLQLHRNPHGNSIFSGWTYLMSYNYYYMSLFVFVVFFMIITFAVGIMCTFHMYLVLAGTTTIELFEKKPMFRPNGSKYVNIYNRGMIRNFLDVFGSSPAYWWLPVFRSHHLDGVRWPSLDDSSSSSSALSYPDLSGKKIKSA